MLPLGLVSWLPTSRNISQSLSPTSKAISNNNAISFGPPSTPLPATVTAATTLMLTAYTDCVYAQAIFYIGQIYTEQTASTAFTSSQYRQMGYSNIETSLYFGPQQQWQPLSHASMGLASSSSDNNIEYPAPGSAQFPSLFRGLLNGPFVFNCTPAKPSVLCSWDTWGIDGRYIGRAMEHYHCYCIYIATTHSERTTNTVELFPKQVTMPKTSSANCATFAMDLV
jgi:hypothetical protein